MSEGGETEQDKGDEVQEGGAARVRIRPPLLDLGEDETSLPAYIAAFDAMYRSGPVKDVFGNRIYFRQDRGRHVCMKSDREDRSSRSTNRRVVWSPDRAKRIPWIMEALLNPYEVRPQRLHGFNRTTVYLLEFPPVAALGLANEFYGVVVDYEAGTYFFDTAYPADRNRWQYWRNGGPRLYPPKQIKEPKLE